MLPAPVWRGSRAPVRRGLTPWDDMWSMIERMDRMFGEEDLQLPIDIEESDDSYKVIADVPGVSRENIEITLEGPELTIAARQEAESEERQRNMLRRERRECRATRTVHLPQAGGEQDVSASLENGVLTVTIKKSEQARARRIEIR